MVWALETWPGLLRHGGEVLGLLCPRRVHGVPGRQKSLIPSLQDLSEELLFAKPNIFSHFTQGVGDPKYLPVTDTAHLNKLLGEVLDSYNEVNAVMNLVSGRHSSR